MSNGELKGDLLMKPTMRGLFREIPLAMRNTFFNDLRREFAAIPNMNNIFNRNDTAKLTNLVEIIDFLHKNRKKINYPKIGERERVQECYERIYGDNGMIQTMFSNHIENQFKEDPHFQGKFVMPNLRKAAKEYADALSQGLGRRTEGHNPEEKPGSPSVRG